MSLKLIEDKPEVGVSVYEMKDGQIARVVENGRVGAIVQRYDERLILLGMENGQSYDRIFKSRGSSMRVEILPNGSQLEVQDNEE